FLDSREREDFYFTISRALFSSSPAVPFPHIHSRPIDLYHLYTHTAIHPFQPSLDYWQTAARQLGFPTTDYVAQKLRHAYKKSTHAHTRVHRSTDRRHS